MNLDTSGLGGGRVDGRRGTFDGIFVPAMGVFADLSRASSSVASFT